MNLRPRPPRLMWRMAASRICPSVTRKSSLGGGADGALRGSLQEQAAEAHVANTRDVVAAIGIPPDPDVFVDHQARIDAA